MKKTKALRAAFPPSIPILAGFLFLGITYGIYMRSQGFSSVYPIITAFFVLAGSVEFMLVGLLQGPFNPLSVLALTLMINARHIFYSISMLEKYKNMGWKKFYLIFGLCDESFTINYTTEIPQDVDRGWFYFFVTLLNHSYWIMGTAIGAFLGSRLSFETKGFDFVLTSLLVVIFLEQWYREDNHILSVTGLVTTALALYILGKSFFIVGAMLVLGLVLYIGWRRKWEPGNR